MHVIKKKKSNHTKEDSVWRPSSILDTVSKPFVSYRVSVLVDILLSLHTHTGFTHTHRFHTNHRTYTPGSTSCVLE